MPRSLPAAGCLRTSLPASTHQQHVWISDALLNESLYNYIHRHRRYGSNVPGPLEARRRATKRKNTSLAHVGHGVAPADAAFLLGNPSASNWWQPLTETQSEQRSSLLPSWLLKPSEPAPSLARKKNLAEVENNTHSEKAEQLKREKNFHWITGSTPTAKLVRDTLHNLQIPHWIRPRLIEVAFRRLLDTVLKSKDASFTLVLDFLSDPTLNLAGTKNHLILVTKLCRQPTSGEIWESTLLPAILRAIQLGLISDASLREIIALLPKLRKTLDATSDTNDLPVADWHRILDAVNECKVLTKDDVGSKFLKKWYDDVADTWPVMAVMDTIRLLTRISTNHGRTDTDVAADLLVKRFAHINSTNDKACDRMADSIRSLPKAMQAEAVLVTTLKLVQLSTRDQSEASLPVWSQILRQLEKEELNNAFYDKHIWASASDTPLELTSMQKFVSLTWAATRFAKSRHELRQHFESSQIQERFRDAMIKSDATPFVQDEMLHQIGTALDSLPLPEKRHTYQALQHLTEHNLLSVMGNKAFRRDITAVMQRDFRKFNDEDFLRWARIHQRDDLTKLAESANWNLPALLRMSQAVISKNKTAIKIIRRIFEHNTAFKIALSRWPEYHAEQMRRRKTTTTTTQLHDTHDLDPESVVDLVHRIAATVAVSPVLSARSAFRQVYYFYLMLHRCGAPIWPGMSRALWHAGVSRYEEGAAPPGQMKWCLSQAHTIEGRDVAMRLSQSAAYRRDVREEMEAFARQLHAAVRDDEAWMDLDSPSNIESVHVVANSHEGRCISNELPRI